MDQRNQLRRRVENNESVLGARAATFSADLIEIYGELGLDFVWLDFEHSGPSPHDSELLGHLTRAADVGGTELFVRLPTVDPPLIRKVLDAGVRNILIPRVDSADEVREAVKTTRFVYGDEPGERGMAGSRSSTWGDAEDYPQREDDEVWLGVMVEKVTAADAIDEILSVRDLGFVFVGQADLSVQMGYPSNRSHPDVVAQVDEIRARSLEHDVPVGTVAHNPAAAVDAIENGYQIVRIGGEIESVKSTIRRRMDEIREHQP